MQTQKLQLYNFLLLFVVEGASFSDAQTLREDEAGSSQDASLCGIQFRVKMIPVHCSDMARKKLPDII